MEVSIDIKPKAILVLDLFQDIKVLCGLAADLDNRFLGPCCTFSMIETKFNEIRTKVCSLEDKDIQDVVWDSSLCKSVVLEFIHFFLSKENICARVNKETLANAFITCICNLLAGNERAATIFLDTFSSCQSVIFQFLIEIDVLACQKWCSVILMCFLQSSLRNRLLKDVPLKKWLVPLCNAYRHPTEYDSFALYCIEHLLVGSENTDELLEAFYSLCLTDQKLIVVVIHAIIKAGEQHQRKLLASRYMLDLIVQIFTSEVGKIYCNDEVEVYKCNAVIMVDTLSVIVSGCFTSPHKDYFQSLDGLIALSIRFLQSLNHATFRPDSKESMALSGKYLKNCIIGTDLSIGCRTDLVHLLGNLAHEHADNQLKIRLQGGMEEIFCSCRKDENNPLMQEAVVFALGQCFKNNPANIQYLRNKLATREDGRDSHLMEMLGLKPDQFVQVPQNSQKE